MRTLNEYEAGQFALMLLTGAPLTTAVRFFMEGDIHEAFIAEAAEKWPQQAEVLEALKKHSGGVEWHKLTDEQRWDLAITKHYNEMAFYLYSHNYADLDGQEKLKADTCRQALENKLAGTAGRADPLLQFYRQVVGKVEVDPDTMVN